MKYDATLAIFNLLKSKLKNVPVEKNIKKEIPDDIKEWYEEWKKNDELEEQKTDNDIPTNTKIEKIISQIKESNNNLCIYYISPRETTARVISNGPEKEKIIEDLILNQRNQMTKDTIYNYLNTVLKDIEIPPFEAQKPEDSSIYECEIVGKKNEKIIIDYDESNYKTNIIMKNNHKNLKISMTNSIISTHYEGMQTIIKNEKKPNIIARVFQKLFNEKSKFELTNQSKAEFISVTKDEILSNCKSYGTVYTQDGVYIFNGEDNKFIINYFETDAINAIIKTKFDVEYDLIPFKDILKNKEDLANTNFIKNLKKYGISANINITKECTQKELQTLTNKAYINPDNLINELK